MDMECVKVISVLRRSAAVTLVTVSVLSSSLSCQKGPGEGGRAVRFGAELDGRMAFVETKASPVTSLSSFYVSAVTGTMGSDEHPVWNSVAFSGGPTYTADPAVTWPVPDPEWKFYGSNVPLTYNATGCTVRADVSTDVVCAMMGAPAYEEQNTLPFRHVFARLGSVTVSEGDAYSDTHVTVTVTPNVSGVYDIYKGYDRTDGWGWSKVKAGSSVSVANATPGTKANDVWMVPGTYAFLVSWTGTKDDYTDSFGPIPVSIPMTAGKVTSVNIMLGGEAEEVLFSTDVRDWGENDINAGTVEAVHDPEVYSFGGLEIASGNLAYEGGTFVIKDEWNYDSYGSVYGVVEGSMNFNFYEMGALFEKSGFGSTDGSIENLLDPFDGWRLPTSTEWINITTMDSPTRVGSTVNGVEGVKFALVRLTGVTHAGLSYPEGLLLFPDGKTIVGKTLNSTNDIYTRTIGVTEAELDGYLSQGCVFMPASGHVYDGNWYKPGLYLCSDIDSGGGTDCNYIYISSTLQTYIDLKNAYHCSIRLVRDID